MTASKFGGLQGVGEMNRRRLADSETKRSERDLFLFNDNNVGIEMNSSHMYCVVSRRQCSARTEHVQLVDEPFGEFNEGTGLAKPPHIFPNRTYRSLRTYKARRP